MNNFTPLKRKIVLSRIRRRLMQHVWVMRILIALGVLAGIFFALYIAATLLSKTAVGEYARLGYEFLTTPEGRVTSINGRTNILVLGKGGAGHEAPDLTDTVIFASVGRETRKISLVSLPRDIWIPAIRAKLNSAYYWGKQKSGDAGGMVLAKSTVEEIVGQPINYVVVVDFNGFKEIIDSVDGVDVDVERGFVDHKFPIPGRETDLCNGDRTFACRYETIEFKQGLTRMDGETALKFVRSRYAEGEEGSDLARSARQQKVIMAIIKKALVSPTKIGALLGAVNKSVKTDVGSDTAAILARWALNARSNLKSYVLPENLLMNPTVSSTYDNQYVFIPRSRNWDEVQKWIESILP